MQKNNYFETPIEESLGKLKKNTQFLIDVQIPKLQNAWFMITVLSYVIFLFLGLVARVLSKSPMKDKTPNQNTATTSGYINQCWSKATNFTWKFMVTRLKVWKVPRATENRREAKHDEPEHITQSTRNGWSTKKVTKTIGMVLFVSRWMPVDQDGLFHWRMLEA